MCIHVRRKLFFSEEMEEDLMTPVYYFCSSEGVKLGATIADINEMKKKKKGGHSRR